MDKIEDEFHVLFECILYDEIRTKFRNLFVKYPSIEEILNPQCVGDAETLGSLIVAIENARNEHGLECITTY